MANCPRCNAPVLQGYDHCTVCGLAFNPPKGQGGQPIPPQGQGNFAPPMQQPVPQAPPRVSQNPAASSFPYVLAAKIDTQGLIWMMTGIAQIGYGVVTAIATVVQIFTFALNGANLNRALFSIVAMLLIIAIGALNFFDGKKRRDNAGWGISHPNAIVEEFSPIQPYLPAFIRNILFVLPLSMGLFQLPVILVGLAGLIGLGFLLEVRYSVLKQVQPPSR